MAISDYMPDFSDPDSMAAWGALGNVLIGGSAPRYSPQGYGVTGGNKINSLAALAGLGMQGSVQGAQGAQAYQQENLANQNSAVMNPINQQTAQMGLEQAQAMQPGQLALLKSMYGDGTSVPGSMGGVGSTGGIGMIPGSGPNGSLTVADQLGARALMAAYASRDQKQISTAYLSLYEHNPQLAGAVKQNVEFNTYQKDASGVPVMPSVTGAFGAPAPTAPRVTTSAPMALPSGTTNGSNIPTPPPATAFVQNPQAVATPAVQPTLQNAATPVAQPRQAAFMPANPASAQAPVEAKTQTVLQQYPNIAKGADGSPMVAADGKPIIPSVANNPFYKPDPTMTPKWGANAGTNDGQKQIEQNIKDLSEGNQSFAQSAQTLSNQKAVLSNIALLMQQTQSGTAIARWPEIAKQAYSLGIISDPSAIKSLSDLQQAIALSSTATLNNIKENAENMGGTSMRIFGSEVSQSIKNGLNVANTPEAMYGLVSKVGGQVNQGLDMINSWQNKAGGAGNRLAGGTTMLPSDFVQQFLPSHPLENYQTDFAGKLAPFKGMNLPKYREGATAKNSEGHTLTFKGGKWQ